MPEIGMGGAVFDQPPVKKLELVGTYLPNNNLHLHDSTETRVVGMQSHSQTSGQAGRLAPAVQWDLSFSLYSFLPSCAARPGLPCPGAQSEDA